MPKLRPRYLLAALLGLFVLKMAGIFTHLYEKDFEHSFHYPYDGNVPFFVHELRHKQTPAVPPINSYDFEYLHDCAAKCLDAVGNFRDLRLMLLVKSAAGNFLRRAAIRNSWGFERRFSDVEIRTVFLVGKVEAAETNQRVLDEASKHQDVVLMNFTDTYFNNTIKTMMGFKWAVRYCPKAKFYLFADDDMFVSMKNVLAFTRNPSDYPRYLQEEPAKEADLFELPQDVRLFAGYVFVSTPHRHRTSKWFVTMEEYPYDRWPPYVTAGAFVVSQSALVDLHYGSLYTRHFRFDDIFLGIVAHKLGIEPFHSEHFHFYKEKYDAKAYRYLVASHGYGDTAELLRTWNELKSLGFA